MKKKIIGLLLFTLTTLVVLKIVQSVDVDNKIQPASAYSILQTQDNRNPKEQNPALESRKRRREDQKQV